MGLRAVVGALTDVPEAARAYYEQKDGKFVLAIDGEPPGFVPETALAEANGKIAKFHADARGLNTKIAELEKTLKEKEAIDPNEVATLRTKLSEHEKKGGSKDTELQALKAAVDGLTKTLADEKAAAAAEKVAAAQALARKDFEAKLTQTAVKAGVDERMLPHFVAHGMRTWQPGDDGKFVPKVGDTVLYNKLGEVVSLEEWVAGQPQEAPGFFKPSGGGDARGRTTASGNGSTPRVLVVPEGQPLRLNAETEKAVRDGTVVIERR